MPTTELTAPAAPHTPTYCGSESSSTEVTTFDISYPTLSTRRFQFRPFRLTDIGPLDSLAGRHRIADTSIGVPHPYTMEFARMWISSHSAAWVGRRALHWAALKVGEDQIVGYAGLVEIDIERGQAELRFWVGCGVERKSDAVEWSAAIVKFALTGLNLNRIYALQLGRHPLAGRVLSAVGMRREGIVRKRIYRGGLVEDLVCWAISRRNS
jgi:ribosomal-protein-alanine N-acetyltransferase